MFPCEDEGIELATIPTEGATQATVSRALNENFAAIGKAIAGLKGGGDQTAALDDLKRSMANIQEEQRKQAEAAALSPIHRGGAGEHDFRRFLDPDGKVILLARSALPGRRRTVGLLDEGVKPVNEWHADLRQLVTTRSLVRAALAKDGPSNGSTTPMLDEELEHILSLAPPEVKRTYSGASGLGSDWAQLAVAPVIYDQLRLPVMPVEDLFEQVSMSTGALVQPVMTTIPRAYRYGTPGPTPSQYTAGDVGTASRTLTAQGLACMIPVFDDAAEDSVVAFAPMIQNALVLGLRLSTIDAWINGDTAATHQDAIAYPWNPGSIFDANATYGGTDDPRKAFLGLRADAFDTSTTTDGSGHTTVTGSGGTLPIARAALKSPHGATGDLIWLTSWQYFVAKISTDANLLTVDKYGPNATVRNGEIGKLFGQVTVVVSELVTADLAASGLYTTGVATYTSALLFNRKRWIRGIRRVASTEIERSASRGVNYIVATRREAFKKVDATADKTVHLTYKI